MESLALMKLSRPKASSAMSGGILLNHESWIWLACASSASRLRPSTGRMSIVVVMRPSASAICRMISGSAGRRSGTSRPASRSACHTFCQSLPRIAVK